MQRVVGHGKENTKFIYDGDEVLLDDDVSSGITKYQNGLCIDNKLRVQTGTDVKYFLADHLGSTNGLTDSTGTVSASTAYDAFGSPTNANFPSRYQYTGREYDAVSGFYYYRARFYDANLGRFISEDPVGLNGGINPYAYVRNNPLGLIDPFGLQDGPVNYLRNPFRSQHWILNGTSNTVSDLLGLDSVARWSWTIGDYRCSTKDRVAAGAKLVGWTAFQSFGGYVAGRGLGWLGRAVRRGSSPAVAGFGDLTASEIRTIQDVVDEAGRPLEVVGSTARGARTPASDIDYLVPPSSLEYFEGLQHKLPGIDRSHGIIPGVGSPNIGPVIRFEPRF